MASKYARAGGGNWNTDATWSTTSGGAADTVKPTEADDVFLDASSGAVTIDAASVGRSLNCTGYTNVLTHNAFTLTLGDATAGASNIALKLVSGMTYTLANVTTSAISLISTSATQQTVTFGGKTVGNFTVNSASNGNFALIDAITMDATATFTSTAGAIHFDGATDNSGLYHYIGKFVSSGSTVRTLTFGTCTIEIIGLTSTWVMSTSANVTVSAQSSTIRFTAANPTSLSLGCVWGGKSYGSVFMEGPGGIAIGDAEFVNLSIIGPYRDDFKCVIVGTMASDTTKVTGTFKVWGDSEERPAFFYGSNNGFTTTLDITGATLDFKYCTFQDTIFETGGVDLDLSAITGGSGDMGNNSCNGAILTFTAPKTTVWNSTGAGSTSDPTKWSNGIPKPQDTIIFGDMSGNPTISVDTIVHMGGVDCSQGSGSFKLSTDIEEVNYFMPFKGRTGLVIQRTSTYTTLFNSRRSTDTLTFNGMTSSAQWNIVAGGGGHITFVDSGSTGATVQHRTGPITIPAGVTLSVSTYASTATSTGVINKATINLYGTLSLFGTGTIFSMTGGATTSVINDYGGTIKISNVSASSKTFAGNGNTYPSIFILGGGTGAVIFTGANTFKRIYFDGAGTKSITLPGSTTTTILLGVDLGNLTNVITFTASAGSATLARASGIVDWDYVNLTNIVSSGTPYFFAGSHSTDGGGNTGWIFIDAPPQSGGGSMKMGISI